MDNLKSAYHAKYWANLITRRFSSETVEKFAKTLSEAQVQLNPHQINAALFAFKSPLSKGAVLADEVGLGKTIEAGIVISQYWAERKRKILIIMPSSLRKQWQQELEEKFFLQSVILETTSFNQEHKAKGVRHNPFEQNRIIICSYNFARSKEEYIKDIDWDLIVIDEAHRLRNVYKKSNKIANSIKEAIKDCDNKILLTATPLQNSLLELYGLVSIIDDYIFGDLASFKARYCRTGQQIDFSELKKRIKPICQRTLRKQVLEYIKYTKRQAHTEKFSPTEEEHQLYIGLTNYLQREKLYALPKSQRKLMTLILRRLLASSTFAISGTLHGLANKLQSMIDNNAALDEETQELYDNIENFDEIKDEWVDDNDESEEAEEKKDYYTTEEIEEIKEEKALLESFYELAKKIDENAKGQKLLTALKTGFKMNAQNGGNRKALIFTESTRTQEYLKRILERTEYKNKIVLFNGSNNDSKSKEIYANWLAEHKGTDRISGSKTADMRAALVEYFRDEAEIMIATEAAAEGINLQFCSLLVNYDLPWNPQRIEQRIGRCHRYGQKHDVVVVNFLNTKNAADVRVFELLSEKFKLFDGVFGVSDEVLGAIGSGIDFEKRIAEILQNCRTEEEINKSFDELQKSMEADIDEKMIDTRKKLLENFDIEVADKLKLSKDKTEKALDKFETKLWELTKYCLNGYAVFDDKKKFFILEKNPFVNLPDINRGPYRFAKNIEVSNLYRVGHPLAQQIINIYKDKSLPFKELVFDYSKSKLNIAILKNLVGKSGYLILKKITVHSFEDEDYLIFAAYCDDGTEIDGEQCEKLFLLDIKEEKDTDEKPDFNRLDGYINVQRQKHLDLISERNAAFFDEEMAKLDKWAEDRKNSLELALKQLDKDIKTQRTEAKKITKLEEKVKVQREIKDMEAKRNKMRRELFDSQDMVDKQKEELIDQIEENMKQKVEEKELFIIRWRLL
jgi:ERCC4-related helicase